MGVMRWGQTLVTPLGSKVEPEERSLAAKGVGEVTLVEGKLLTDDFWHQQVGMSAEEPLAFHSEGVGFNLPALQARLGKAPCLKSSRDATEPSRSYKEMGQQLDSEKGSFMYASPSFPLPGSPQGKAVADQGIIWEIKAKPN